MVPAGNKAKRLLSVNHTTKTIHHHHHHHHHQSYEVIVNKTVKKQTNKLQNIFSILSVHHSAINKCVFTKYLEITPMFNSSHEFFGYVPLQ